MPLEPLLLTPCQPLISCAALLGIAQGAICFIVERDDQTPQPPMLVHDAHFPREKTLVIVVDAVFVVCHGGPSFMAARAALRP